ncbi:hypothetical protein HYR69_09340 [Candidatus Sumerlaeota bacterium]|nr:hypothetical protein [Candidatus Sumerlaeota bacterium]
MNENRPNEFEIDDLVDQPQSAPVRETIEENSTLPLKHFKLSSHPFADSVNPEYFTALNRTKRPSLR